MVSRRPLTVLALLVASIAAAAPLGAAPASDRWDAHVVEAASRFGIPELWIWEVMRVESGGRTHMHGRPIVSHAGAMGLMQIMPGTYVELARRHGLGPDPHNPRDNIMAGAAYLRAMHDRFGSPGFLAAYNAGPARYAEHIAAGRPLPRETRAYLATISVRLNLPAQAVRPLAARTGTTMTGASDRQPQNSLFFPLRGQRSSAEAKLREQDWER